MNIEFEREFDINNYEDVKSKVYDFGKVTINNNISFDLSDIKNSVKFVPLKKRIINLIFTYFRKS